MKSVCIIAEAGVNHNGNINIAREMIRQAKLAGADYIKFQTFIPEKLVSRYAEKAVYQRDENESNSQLDMLQRLALTYDDFYELKAYCDQIGIGFLSTPFDFKSIHFLDDLDLDFWKIPSGEMTNLPYLEKIGETQKKVVISTGMCEMSEIEDAVNILENKGVKDITILHCNTEYPTPFEDVNLLAMNYIAEFFNRPVGYSDHTSGIEIPIAAVALGAVVIEKHFTLDKKMEGPDHLASLNPTELTQMISAIRNVEKGLGVREKKRTVSEAKNCVAARKSIIAQTKIRCGEFFTDQNLTVKRPGNGISPMNWYKLIGKRASRDYEIDELIEEDLNK